jgi:4-amino-4-deoxy-L-arabinose transferase-like glycosyltransferase
MRFAAPISVADNIIRPTRVTSSRRAPLALALLVGALVLFGAFVRFAGLGKWPLAMDEYYLARSVQNILRVGLPQYPCGGFYLRGLALQYGAAGLELTGVTPELALRLIAALASLIALPATYLLGKRLGGTRVALVAVAILAISVWEIEMARFGRMYAPFQAVFLWYLFFFFRYTLDHDRRALAPMLALSVLGMFLWEGGVFLAFANLLPPVIEKPSGRFARRDWGYLAATALLLVVGYHLSTREIVPSGSGPDLPPGFQEPASPLLGRLDAGTMPWTTLGSHPFWLAAALIPAALTVFAAIWIVRSRRGLQAPLGTLALLAALASALLQQFGLAVALLLTSLLLAILPWRDLTARRSRPLHVALAASAVFWIAFGLATQGWHVPTLAFGQRALLLGYEFVRFPDVFRVVVVPLARVVPGLALGLALLLAADTFRAVHRPADTPLGERVALALLAIMLLGSSVPPLPRYETRYVFFLYPLAIILALRTIDRGVASLAARRFALGRTLAAPAAVILSLAAFAASEDFKPRHLWNIDTAAVNFRIGMSGPETEHYHPRSDVRGAARWLTAHANPGRDIVVLAFPSVDFYYHGSNYFFMEESDPRFDAVSCRAGTTERWSNRPLLRTVAMLQGQVATGRKVWMVVDAASLDSLLSQLPAREWKLEWTSPARRIIVISMQEQLTRAPSQLATRR